jgi:hypothetical protein
MFIDVKGGSTTSGVAIDAAPYSGGSTSQYFLAFPG